MSKNAQRNKFNIHQCISKSMNIFIFILLFIIIKVKTFSFFKTIPTLNNRYYIICPNKIIFLNNYLNKYDIKEELENDQIIESEDEYEKISYGRLDGITIDQAQLLIIKDYIYELSQ